MLLLVLHRWDAVLTRSRLLRPFSFCGEMCYSLYLVHWPVVTVASWAFSRLGLRNPFAILFLGVPFCLAVSVSLARLFHKLIERRFWNPSYSRTQQKTETIEVNSTPA